MNRNLQILLADDDEDDRFVFRMALAAAGLDAELIMVEDGLQLTSFLSAAENPPPPDVIFLDINMPVKNGKECLVEIRNNQKFDKIFILMFSTSSHKTDIEQSFAAGANRYIFKSQFFQQDVKILQELFSPGWEKQLAGRSKQNFIYG